MLKNCEYFIAQKIKDNHCIFYILFIYLMNFMQIFHGKTYYLSANTIPNYSKLTIEYINDYNI
jgi:hypothetical protein